MSITLYLTDIRKGRRNLALRHSVSHFPLNSGGIACQVAEHNAALCLDTRAKKWKYKFSRVGTQPVDFTFWLWNFARIHGCKFMNEIGTEPFIGESDSHFTAFFNKTGIKFSNNETHYSDNFYLFVNNRVVVDFMNKLSSVIPYVLCI